MGKKVILAGGSGFIGTLLAHRLQREGWDVVVLTRRPPLTRPDGILEVQWPARPIVRSNPTRFETHGTWIHAIDGAEAMINLAGRSVKGLPTPENQRQILDSRLDAVRVLGAALEQCRQLPRVWIQCSAVGFYGPRGLPACDEQSARGEDFLADVCRQWEDAFIAACPASVRPVVLRLGLVLSTSGGVLPLLASCSRWFLGGAAGNGRQGICWIHEADLEKIVLRLMDSEAMSGTYNACAPHPVSNAEFMQELRRNLHRPWCPPVPEKLFRLAAKFVLRTNPALVLEGQFAAPARLLAEGFEFEYAQLPAALQNLAAH